MTKYQLDDMKSQGVHSADFDFNGLEATNVPGVTFKCHQYKISTDGEGAGWTDIRQLLGAIVIKSEWSSIKQFQYK